MAENEADFELKAWKHRNEIRALAREAASRIKEWKELEKFLRALMEAEPQPVSGKIVKELMENREEISVLGLLGIIHVVTEELENRIPQKCGVSSDVARYILGLSKRLQDLVMRAIEKVTFEYR
ncbi:MAG: hypothetical protein JRD89_09330 [Deltaproteobacteria bacterium]|nr:hypothetical protein [Deltaproteobacteria bacterium]